MSFIATIIEIQERHFRGVKRSYANEGVHYGLAETVLFPIIQVECMPSVVIYALYLFCGCERHAHPKSYKIKLYTLLIMAKITFVVAGEGIVLPDLDLSANLCVGEKIIFYNNDEHTRYEIIDVVHKVGETEEGSYSTMVELERIGF